MLHFIANSLVIAGIFLQLLALRPVRQLILLLPPGRLRLRWFVLTALIFIFIIGYGAYIPAFWGSHEQLADLVVPAVFFLGACFVLVVNFLSLETTRDVRHMSVLEQESITDPLMGIYNRRYLERRLTTEVARASRYGMPLSVLLLDIDHFKPINDSYGHQVGDVVLAELAQLIVNTVRTTDIVTRYGGEEIMVMAPSTPLKTAANLAERLRKIIAHRPFDVPAKLNRKLKALHITASVGVACFGLNANDFQSLIQSADEALYRAKKKGRNCVITARPVTTQP
jgi:diguanylate cyclase (GGDEF)-like protein